MLDGWMDDQSVPAWRGACKRDALPATERRTHLPGTTAGPSIMVTPNLVAAAMAVTLRRLNVPEME